MFELRLAVETMAARLAAERVTAQDVARLEQCQQDLESSRDVHAFRRADSEFHLTVARISGNDMLCNVVEDVRAAVHPDTLMRWGTAPPVGLTAGHRAAALLLPACTLTSFGVMAVTGVRIPFLLALIAQITFSFLMRPKVFAVLNGLVLVTFAESGGTPSVTRVGKVIS